MDAIAAFFTICHLFHLPFVFHFLFIHEMKDYLQYFHDQHKSAYQ